MKTIHSNKLNKASTPLELAEALSYRGGLQNCGVQVVEIHDSGNSQLQGIQATMESVQIKMNKDKCLSRMNEINYFPETDENDGMRFRMRVFSYSGVGPGTEFIVDFDKGTYSVEGIGEPVVEDDVQNDDKFAEDVFSYTSFELGNDEVTNDSNSEQILEALWDEMDHWGSGEKRLIPSDDLAEYASDNMLTGVKVTHVMHLGELVTTIQKKPVQVQSDMERTNTLRAEKKFLLRAAHFLSSESYSTFGIRDGLDENVAEYEMANGYEIPAEMFPDGWARRPRTGDMYGPSYLAPHEAKLLEFFEQGCLDSSKKMSPPIMLARLKANNPGIYSIPGISQIQSRVTQWATRQKKGENITLKRKNESRREVPECIIRAISGVVDFYSGQILPMHAVRLAEKKLPNMPTTEQKKAMQNLAKKAIDAWKATHLNSRVG